MKKKTLKPRFNIKIPSSKVIIPDKLNFKKNRRKTKQKLRKYL